jgi:PPP family 3-phenylpropionic acid transporter
MPAQNQPLPYWRLSSFYFFYFATLGGFLPYWTLYLKHKQFSALQIGELTALIMITKIISPNVGGIIADKTGKNLKVVHTACFLTLFLFSGFFFKEGFIWYAIITLGYSFFWNISLPQVEVLTLFHLQKEPHRYGQIRLWGSVGFIVAVLAIGKYLDHQPIETLPWIVLGLFAGIWLASLCVPEVQKNPAKHDALKMGQILKQPEVIAFFAVYFLLQGAHGPYYAFYSIHLQKLHYSSTWIGGLWVAGVFAEVFLFMVMRKVLDIFSLRAVLLVSIFLSIFRWLIIAFSTHSLYWLAGAQLLHAASFGATHIAAMHFIHHYFGQHHQGKGQALYASLSFGIGGTAGSLVSGYYWDAFGARFIFGGSAACCVLAFLIAYPWVGRKINLSAL